MASAAEVDAVEVVGEDLVFVVFGFESEGDGYF